MHLCHKGRNGPMTLSSFNPVRASLNGSDVNASSIPTCKLHDLRFLLNFQSLKRWKKSILLQANRMLHLPTKANDFFLHFLCLNHLPLLCSSCWMHTPPKYVEYKNNNSTALFWWLDYWKGLNVKEKIPFPQSWSIRCAGRIMFSLLLLKSFSPHTDRTFLSPVSAVFTTSCMKTSLLSG